MNISHWSYLFTSYVICNNEKQYFRDSHFWFYLLRYKEFEINAINTTWDLELNKVGELAPCNILKNVLLSIDPLHST